MLFQATTTSTILSLLTLAQSIPFIPNIQSVPHISPETHNHNHNHTARALQGSCPTTHLSTEATYISAYQSFCTTYLPQGQAHTITETAPLVATFDQPTHDGSAVYWIYKISARDGMPGTEFLDVDQDMCLKQFADILETDRAGGLGKAWCVVDGTGGDKIGVEGMSGQGVVLMQGGSVEVNGLGRYKAGKLIFETRKRIT